MDSMLHQTRQARDMTVCLAIKALVTRAWPVTHVSRLESEQMACTESKAPDSDARV